MKQISSQTARKGPWFLFKNDALLFGISALDWEPTHRWGLGPDRESTDQKDETIIAEYGYSINNDLFVYC